MKSEDTICYKVSESIREIEDSLTGQFDLLKVAKNLHDIRSAAQRMENALKARKAFLQKAGLENEYQEEKKKRDMHDGVNTIANKTEIRKERMNFEVLIKDNGKTVYHNMVHSGVLSIVEEVTDIDEDGTMTGRTQKFLFGHILGQWYGFDQLRQYMEAKSIAILTEMSRRVKEKQFSDPLRKKNLLSALNQMVK